METLLLDPQPPPPQPGAPPRRPGRGLHRHVRDRCDAQPARAAPRGHLPEAHGRLRRDPAPGHLVGLGAQRGAAGAHRRQAAEDGLAPHHPLPAATHGRPGLRRRRGGLRRRPLPAEPAPAQTRQLPPVRLRHHVLPRAGDRQGGGADDHCAHADPLRRAARGRARRRAAVPAHRGQAAVHRHHVARRGR